ncbi:MAG TPA: YbhB/YbcL family Raf kinase inhibitor-like protein [bacterium]|nr:YbhB/YbcL family Raf kinase inhibitor-like protein [bacterium]
MNFESSAFTEEGAIPAAFAMPAAGGTNRSLPFHWSDEPAGTRSFALSIVDPHPVANNWVHWLVVNIPADVHALAGGASGSKMPPGCQELRNGFGQAGYGGPQPPPGSGRHPYVCTLFALDVERVLVTGGTSLEAFHAAMHGHIIDKAEITGTYRQ